MDNQNNFQSVWKILAIVMGILIVVLVLVIVFTNLDNPHPIDSSEDSSQATTECTTEPIVKKEYVTEAEAYDLCVLNGNKYGVDPLLILSIIHVESSFRTNADSGVAKGLMQIMPETYYGEIQKRVTELYDKDASVLFDPYYNTLSGAYYLYRLEKSLKTTNEIIVAYNWGITNVQKLLSDETGEYTTDGKTLIYNNIPSESAKSYLRKVTEAYEFYKQKYNQ